MVYWWMHIFYSLCVCPWGEAYQHLSSPQNKNKKNRATRFSLWSYASTLLNAVVKV